MVWDTKANLRGPAGYNATGAAEDAESLAAFTLGTAGPNPFSTALTDVIGETAGAVNLQVGDAYPPRPNAAVVTWVGLLNPDAFMADADYWVSPSAPAPLTLLDIQSQFLDPTSSLTTAAGNGIAAGASLWVPAPAFASAVGAPTLNGLSSTYLSSVPVWRLDPNIVESVAASVVVPRGWAAAKIALFYATIGTGGGSVRFIVNMNSLNPGTLISTSSQNLEPSQDVGTVANTVGQLVPAAGNSYAVSPAVPLRITVGRRADNVAGDTCPDDIGFLGLLLTRQS